MLNNLRRRLGALLILTALLVSAGSIPAQAASDTTSPLERTRVDRVPTPDLDWVPCDLGECATMTVPLDYDDPDGATVEVAVTRIPARDQANRIGSLVLNPGGPGGQGTSFPMIMEGILGDEVLDHFDIVGFDPRGSHLSTNTRCFARSARQQRVFGIINEIGFPVTKGEERRFISAERQVAMNCSDYGEEMTSSMSTAEVARDMDVLRRGLGDEQLTYFGISYGSYLGQVYANMFPDRARALVIDGVLDPVAWSGTAATKNVPVTARIRSAEGSSGALSALLQQCDAAGDLCPLQDPEADFARVADALLDEPVVIEDPEAGELTITYQVFVSTMLGLLYSDLGAEMIPFLVADVDALQGGGLSAEARGRTSLAVMKALDFAVADEQPYVSAEEVFPAVLCSDSLNPRKTRTWQDLAPAADEQAPYFGRSWLWSSVVCADQMWNADDEDAWRGPFNKVTSETVLVVGNKHDPATPYSGAVAAASILPNSRLLSSDNWGHAAYFSSECAKNYIDAYLVDQSLPPEGTWCTDGYQPFTP